MALRCPHCQSAKHPNWMLYAALILAALTIANNIRTDKEYRSVRAVRMEGDSLLSNWQQKKCVPRDAAASR